MSTVRKEELTFGHRQCVKPDQVKKETIQEKKRKMPRVFHLFSGSSLSSRLLLLQKETFLSTMLHQYPPTPEFFRFVSHYTE